MTSLLNLPLIILTLLGVAASMLHCWRIAEQRRKRLHNALRLARVHIPDNLALADYVDAVIKEHA